MIPDNKQNKVKIFGLFVAPPSYSWKRSHRPIVAKSGYFKRSLGFAYAAEASTIKVLFSNQLYVLFGLARFITLRFSAKFSELF